MRPQYLSKRKARRIAHSQRVFRKWLLGQAQNYERQEARCRANEGKVRDVHYFKAKALETRERLQR